MQGPGRLLGVMVSPAAVSRDGAHPVPTMLNCVQYAAKYTSLATCCNAVEYCILVAGAMQKPTVEQQTTRHQSYKSHSSNCMAALHSRQSYQATCKMSLSASTLGVTIHATLSSVAAQLPKITRRPDHAWPATVCCVCHCDAAYSGGPHSMNTGATSCPGQLG